MNETGEVDITEHLQLPGVAPGCLINLLKRSARNVAGIVDENVDAGGLARQPMQVICVAQIDGVRNDIDLMSRA